MPRKQSQSAEGSTRSIRTIATGVAFGESVRWHDDRVWFCDWIAREVISVAPDGDSRKVHNQPEGAPISIDWRPDGTLLVLDGGNRQLLEYGDSNGLHPVVDDLRTHCFNSRLWPDFTKLPTPEDPVLRLQTLREREAIEFGSLSVVPVPVQHAVPAAGFIIHSAIHQARHDAKCVLHTHTLNGVAVAAQQDGLLPLSQHSMSVLSSIGYHDYEGPALNADEKPRLVADLGSAAHLILRNHGLLTVGDTVADAFVRMYYLETSCAIQLRAQAGGGELIHIGKEILETAYGAMQAGGGAGSKASRLVWPGILRRLDRLDPSFRD